MLLLLDDQLDVTSAQLLLTDSDFKDPEFREQLSETVNSLLALRVVPVCNENDAISTRKAPYKVTIHLQFYSPWLLQIPSVRCGMC